MSGLAETGDSLVHDTAVHADVLVLGALSDLSQFQALNLVVAEEVVETVGEAALEGCAGAHACSEGHITCKGGVETFDGNAESHHLAADTEDIASPRGLGTCGVVEGELNAILQVNAIGVNVAGAVGLDFGNHALFHGAGEHETVVIVGVLADEVDAAGGCIDISCAAIEVLDEAAANVVNSQFHSLESPPLTPQTGEDHAGVWVWVNF